VDGFLGEGDEAENDGDWRSALRAAWEEEISSMTETKKEWFHNKVTLAEQSNDSRGRYQTVRCDASGGIRSVLTAAVLVCRCAKRRSRNARRSASDASSSSRSSSSSRTSTSTMRPWRMPSHNVARSCGSHAWPRSNSRSIASMSSRASTRGIKPSSSTPSASMRSRHCTRSLLRRS